MTGLDMLIMAWRAGERVPLWDALCEAAPVGIPSEEWVAIGGVGEFLHIGDVRVAAVFRGRNALGRMGWEFSMCIGDVRREHGWRGTAMRAKCDAREAAIRSLKGEP